MIDTPTEHTPFPAKMSWLFGMNKNQGDLVAPQVPVMDGAEGQQQGGGPAPVGAGSDKDGYRSEAYSFDSTALERAAKAAKVKKEI